MLLQPLLHYSSVNCCKETKSNADVLPPHTFVSFVAKHAYPAPILGKRLSSATRKSHGPASAALLTSTLPVADRPMEVDAHLMHRLHHHFAMNCATWRTGESLRQMAVSSVLGAFVRRT